LGLSSFQRVPLWKWIGSAAYVVLASVAAAVVARAVHGDDPNWMDANGGNLRRITRHPNIDATPTWSPAGNQIAFTSDRSGSPQIYVVDADGLGQPQRITSDDSWADRATWSPAPFNEIAYAARNGPGFDIKIRDMTTGQSHFLTNGEGSNESPAFSPTGRHIAFASTRLGNQQIFVVGRDGNGLRQVTKEGNNYTPNWSR